ARVQRGSSQTARCTSTADHSNYAWILITSPRGVAGLSYTARIEGPPYQCGASASKKDGLAAPLRPFQDRSLLLYQGWPGLVPHCARRTSTALSCAFREHEGPTGHPPDPSDNARYPTTQWDSEIEADLLYVIVE